MRSSSNTSSSSSSSVSIFTVHPSVRLSVCHISFFTFILTMTGKRHIFFSFHFPNNGKPINFSLFTSQETGNHIEFLFSLPKKRENFFFFSFHFPKNGKSNFFLFSLPAERENINFFTFLFPKCQNQFPLDTGT